MVHPRRTNPFIPKRSALLALALIALALGFVSLQLAATWVYVEPATLLSWNFVIEDQAQQQLGIGVIWDTISNNDDLDCIFRDSPLYKKVFVYPTVGEKHFQGDILSKAGRKGVKPWPWIEMEQIARANQTGHFDILSQTVQYATELLVRELFINPKSCLRTYNPEEATLFYVPYMPSMERRKGDMGAPDYGTSPFAQAILDILEDGNYQAWEDRFGLTSTYWKRRNGADHILVFSEPLHGFTHPRMKRGNFHYVNTQKQLKPPIVISVELSTTFVRMYPNCAAKNIVVPYPNTNGMWFNGAYNREVAKIKQESNLSSLDAAHPYDHERPAAFFYAAGMHGECRNLRKHMANEYRSCSKSTLIQKFAGPFQYGMRLSTFCPAPGGDSPSAKRMFDALLAGCIPVVISEDFVWPFTTEVDKHSASSLHPSHFSVRYAAQEVLSDEGGSRLDSKTCELLNSSTPDLWSRLSGISAPEIRRLKEGVDKARQLYSWYAERRDFPDNPLLENILPDGGTAHYVVQALAERANGVRWPACEAELKLPREPDPTKFKC